MGAQTFTDTGTLASEPGQLGAADRKWSVAHIFDSGIDQWLYWQANSRPDFYAWKADRLHTVDDAASGHFDQLARPVLSPFHSTEVNDG